MPSLRTQAAQVGVEALGGEGERDVEACAVEARAGSTRRRRRRGAAEGQKAGLDDCPALDAQADPDQIPAAGATRFTDGGELIRKARADRSGEV